MRSVILFSGGMDSTVLLAQTIAQGGEALALVFDYGQRHREREKVATMALCRHYSVERQVICLDMGQWVRSALTGADGALAGAESVVPGRNGVLVSVAAAIAESRGAGEVLIGSHAGDHAIYPDCRPAWTYYQAQTIHLGSEGRVQVRAPLSAWRKEQIVAEGNRLEVPWELTWSCYAGGSEPCGECGACVERGKVLA